MTRRYVGHDVLPVMYRGLLRSCNPDDIDRASVVGYTVGADLERYALASYKLSVLVRRSPHYVTMMNEYPSAFVINPAETALHVIARNEAIVT